MIDEPIMRAIVVIPTFNERQNLELLVGEIFNHAPGLSVLIVDDNSPDGTGVLADELSRKFPDKFFVLHQQTKAGLGRAYVAGFRLALDMGFDVILQMDADLSHDPSYLSEFLRRIASCDIVLGSRYLRGVSVINWDLKRLLLSKFASLYVRLITGMPFTDPTGGFKCWRRDALQAVDLDTAFSNGYLFQVETTFKAMRKGYRIEEIQIVFTERNLGRSKMNWNIIGEAVLGVLRLRWQRWWPPSMRSRRQDIPIHGLQPNP